MNTDIKLTIAAAVAAVNIITFFIYGIDKRRAKKAKRRISEKTLLLWSVTAPFSAFAAMRVFHHKTQKPKFYITVPLLCILHLAAAAVIYFKL